MDMQYIRLDNSILCGKDEKINSPATVGLYALLSAFLSNPSFRTPNGGLHHAIARHCANGRHSLNRQWKTLYQAGYLKRTRLPNAAGILHDYYSLLTVPDEEIPSARSLSFREGLTWTRAFRSFEQPSVQYTPINYAMLMDPALSLSAKGMYSIIQRYLILSQHVSDVSICQDKIRRACHMGATAFRTTWRELCQKGYLTVTRVWKKKQRGVSYVYSLRGNMIGAPSADAAQTKRCPPLEQKQPTAPIHMEQNKNQKKALFRTSQNNQTRTDKQSRKNILPLSTSSCPSPSCAEEEERAWIQESVELQIERDVLLARGHAKETVDLIVQIITDVLLEKEETITLKHKRHKVADLQKTLRALEAEDIEEVLSTLRASLEKEKAGQFKIHRLRPYLLACLLNARQKVEEKMALWGARWE